MIAGHGRADSLAADILVAATRADDLTFPTEPVPFSVTNPRMGLYKPSGRGPFPAIVLAPHCNGLGSLNGYPNLSIGRWGREMLDRGYVVLLIDSQGARGIDSTCIEPKGAVYHIRGALDVLQAAAHLRTLGYVDKRRIAVVGFSWGAMAGLLAASRFNQLALKIDTAFAAVVSVYPLCAAFVLPQGRPYEIVNRDIDRPGLVLMGSDDLEAPPNLCVSSLQAAAWQGAPVEWHVFPHATHCWDCAHLDGYAKVDFRGTRVEYRFDGDLTADTRRRIFSFLDKAWTGGK
ncbi:MAG: prolyl oligopeptidase family serine peptidase [Proteobacteria bacterium]|nr:prolyl oligopeptidase family serine peptidase [Pseudomonadota bacterium]